MINLLPPQDKQEFKREIIFKKILVILFFHFIGLLILVSALSFTSAYFSQQTEIVKEQVVKQEEQAKSAQFQAYKADAAGFNNTLAKLQSFWQGQILASDFIEKFLPIISADTHLKSLSFVLSSKKITVAQAAASPKTGSAESSATPESAENIPQIIFGAVKVEGVVDSRDGLYEFKKLLEGQKEFQGVVFAPSSWSKAKFPDFSLNFSFFPIKK